MRWFYATCLSVIVALAAGWAPQRAAGQNIGTIISPILTIESDRFFAQSAFGRRVASEIEAEGAILAKENRKIEADLTAEEKALTDKRASMDPAAFRALADTFDEKVQTMRRTQDTKSRALAERNEAGRTAFINAAGPILEVLMRDTGAAVVLERRSVFLSANAIDVTDDAIRRMDAAIGNGSDLSPKQ
ncbi:MAG: OmpH family outer membrane protein [Paracoccaceae bacterium]